MSSLAHLDPAAERERFERRRALLESHWALRLALAEGITFQPETEASVQDQIRETLWAEGTALEDAAPGELAEVRESFAVLTPGREPGADVVAASLFLAFPDAVRSDRLEALRGFPDQLQLELASGARVAPEVDRGAAGPGDRLPSVLALRYRVPDGDAPVALVSGHPVAPGRFPAPAAWSRWIPAASGPRR